MLLGFPTAGEGGLQGEIGLHFGRASTYTLVNPETKDVEVVPNQSEHMGGSGLPANILAESGVDILICSGLGRKAINLFAEHGVEVYIGAEGTVDQALRDWREGNLTQASQGDGCTEGKFGKGDH